jgi:hypothetical protein
MSQKGNTQTFIEKIKKLNVSLSANDILRLLHGVEKIGITKKGEFIVKNMNDVKWNIQSEINENNVIWVNQDDLPTSQEISEASTYWHRISSADIPDALAIVVFLIELEYDEKKDHIYSKTGKYEFAQSSEFDHATFDFWLESNYLDYLDSNNLNSNNLNSNNLNSNNSELSLLSQYWISIFKKRFC